MIAGFLFDLERDLTRIADDIDGFDQDYELNPQIDGLRDIARRIAVEAERIKLSGKSQ